MGQDGRDQSLDATSRLLGAEVEFAVAREDLAHNHDCVDVRLLHYLWKGR